MAFIQVPFGGPKHWSQVSLLLTGMTCHLVVSKPCGGTHLSGHMSLSFYYWNLKVKFGQIAYCRDKKAPFITVPYQCITPHCQSTGALHNLPHHYYAGFTHLWFLGMNRLLDFGWWGSSHRGVLLLRHWPGRFFSYLSCAVGTAVSQEFVHGSLLLEFLLLFSSPYSISCGFRHRGIKLKDFIPWENTNDPRRNICIL